MTLKLLWLFQCIWSVICINVYNTTWNLKQAKKRWGDTEIEVEIYDIWYCILHAAVPHTALLQILSYIDNFIHDIVYCIPQFRVPQGCRSFLITIISYRILYTACRSSAYRRLQIFSYNDNFIHYIRYCILHTAVLHAAWLQIYSCKDNFIHDIQHIS